jgi:hypothetical protein
MGKFLPMLNPTAWAGEPAHPTAHTHIYSLTHDLFQAFYESTDAFGSGFFLEGAVGDSQVARIFHAEGHAGDDGDFVLFDQLPDEVHRIRALVDSQQEIKSAVCDRHCN